MSLIVAEYRCPVHGVFESTVERPAPDDMPCPFVVEEQRAYCYDTDELGNPSNYYQDALCEEVSPWTYSAPMTRVRLAEVVRGASEQAASPMYLSTRELGEGMPYSEFRAKRDKMYEERRHKESKDL